MLLTGSNDYYMMAERDSIHMGLDEGNYALWLDDTLRHGCSCACVTFANKPLATSRDFAVAAVELWSVK